MREEPEGKPDEPGEAVDSVTIEKAEDPCRCSLNSGPVMLFENWATWLV